MDIVLSFTNRFRELINDAGVSLIQISKEAEIDFTELMHWKSEKNRNLPSTRNLLKLANYFKCSFDYILGIKDEKDFRESDTDLSDFPKRLCQILEKKKLKLFILKRTGKFEFNSSINNWKTGKTMPNVYNLVCLSEKLGCSVDYLLGRGD